MAKKKSAAKKEGESGANGNANVDGHVNGDGLDTSLSSSSSSYLSLLTAQMAIAPANPSATTPTASPTGARTAAPASASTAATTAPAPKKFSVKGVAPLNQQAQSALIISRNKHWRYISAYHGSWLQLPPEILETLANINWNTARPRPIDPSVFFDVAKIRRLVEMASDYACRAASGVASNNQVPGATSHLHQANSLGLGYGFRPGNHNRLSAERRYRMRLEASQKLAKAYRLDEIACSVSIMQSASFLEDVATSVLERSPSDPDAKYVHFFHEKIPSRQLAECTSLDALNEVIQSRPSDPEPLRTRGTVRIFKEDFNGAIADFTEALRVHRVHFHTVPQPVTDQQIATRTSRRQDVILKEEEHPSSLETSVLFQRAGVYLSIACKNAAAAFTDQGTADSDLPPEVLEARKQVRTNAKRALRDYTAYLSRFEYSPNIPISIAEEFYRKVKITTDKDSKARYSHRSVSPDGAGNSAPHRIYAVSQLFASSPPSDLRPYPNTEVLTQPPVVVDAVTTTETLTYHPLMTEALHCLLICHCLIQTSSKELLRHAYMVARLARLSDGYPIFQTSRSPARSDWMEIIRATENWIQLSGSWEQLCKPTPLPFFQSGPDGTTSVHIPYDVAQSLNHPLVGAARALTLPEYHAATPSSMATLEIVNKMHASQDEARQAHERNQIMLDAFGDERVRDEESFHRAVRARQLRADREYKIDNAVRKMDLDMIRQAQKLGLAAEEEEEEKSATDAAASEAKKALLPANGDGDTANKAIASASPSDVAVVAPTPPEAGEKEKRAGSGSGSGSARPVPAANRNNDPDESYTISTERAMAVARWIIEAPPNAGVVPGEAKKRKKKPAARG